MTTALAIGCAVHGLIHLMGAAKRLQLVWFAACGLFLATGVALFAWPRGWWILGGAAIVTSTIAIASSWREARFGVIPNALILFGVVIGFMSEGPLSLHAQYEMDVRGADAPATHDARVDEDDLAGLPEPVQRYLRRAGVVGEPRVWNFSARMHGRIRQGPASPWMELSTDQQNVVDRRTRYFYMTSSMYGLPVLGYHRYATGAATMHVKAGGLVTVAHASGIDMTRAETVTLFNDMAVLAPATLTDPAIAWEPINRTRARATFSTGTNAIRADLVFSDEGDLVNFISDDRCLFAADGSARWLRWSTPISDYRVFGKTRLASKGAGRWHDGTDVYSYLELTIDDVRYNTRR